VIFNAAPSTEGAAFSFKLTACFACHQSQRGREYVFSSYRP